MRSVLLGVLVLVGCQDRIDQATGGSPSERTRIHVHRVANEYFARWSLKSADRPCPDNLLEMGRAVDSTMHPDKMKDSWGRELRFLCGDALPAGAKGLAVYSFGENGRDEAGAGDDIKSW